MKSHGRAALAVYVASSIACGTLIPLLLRAARLSVQDPPAGMFIIALMWTPALARLIAVRTFDRGWVAPLPLRRWGSSRSAPVVVPLAVVGCIYIGAYLLAAIARVPLGLPVWRGASAILNVAVNLPLLTAIGAFGAIGEELGWRGYLQPRLEQLRVPWPLACVIVTETLFHLPLILLGGYTAGESRILSVVLFFGLKIGATTVWTWATYRWRTLWIAVGFHTFHNAISQVIVPKLLGQGNPQVLGEFGFFPVALYLLMACAVVTADRWPRLEQPA